MLSTQEVEMLAGLVMRAGVNSIEATWANAILDRLRAAALEQQAEAALEQGKEGQDDADRGHTDAQP